MTALAEASFDTRSLGSFRSVGGVLPADLIATVITGSELPGLGAGDYHLELGVTPREAANRAWATLRGAWGAYREVLARGRPDDPPTSVTRERWLLVLLRELGFGRVPPTPPGGLDADGRRWPVSHIADGRLPVHLLGWGVSLDGKRTPRLAGAADRAPQAMLQDLLNRSSDYLWGVLANGSRLRLLRDSSSLVGPAYVEFDLVAIFDGELFSDFVALYLLCHQSRFEPTDPEVGMASCWLERWRDHAVETGTRALGALRLGVHDAIEALGTGLIAHPANGRLRAQLETGQLVVADFHRGLLRLIYRLLFCFVAEDRGLLLDPRATATARERYQRWFSTARLRRLAQRRAGDGHSDLWQALKLILDALGQEAGCESLALAGLGGIFDPGPIDLDPDLALSNRALLAAVWHLCVTRPVPGGPRRVVDYRHLGAEELGGIYESLLEYVPHYDIASRSFRLELVSGNDRKKSGAYYTPSSLIACLLDSALDPLLDRAEHQADPETALLSLRVCDPACGSGHFLVAAGRRIAGRLAVLRADGAEPSLDEVHQAIHDVVSRCLYGVDLNPMATELTKVSLWLEGMQAGRPLSLLDAHIKVGNALLGATPAQLAAGLPDEAFNPIEGDDKRTAAALKKMNKAERGGQARFSGMGSVRAGTAGLAAEVSAVDRLVPASLADVHVAAQRLGQIEASPELGQARMVADAWCSAFVLAKKPGSAELTQAVLADLSGGKASPELVDAVEATSARYRWFHWHIEFPQIFTSPDGKEAEIASATGWAGGFDCVVGNPPWERVKLQEQEWFASRVPAIARAQNSAARKKLISSLAETHPDLYAEFLAARRQAEGESHFIRNSGRYPLAGRGDVNTYAVFAETDRALLGATGRLGVILPTGIATDATTQYLFNDLVTTRALVSLYDFENSAPLFEGVHRSFKFCLLTLAGRSVPTDRADFAFFAHHPDDLKREGARFRLTPEEIALLNPNTGTCPVFRSRRDAEITLGIYRRHPILIRRGDPDSNPWGLSFMTMFHMSNDSGLFHTRCDLEAEGWTLEGNVFHRASEKMLPLYEAKMVHHYDHRWATYTEAGDVRDVTDAEHADPEFAVMPRYWVAATEVGDRVGERWQHRWLLGFRNITNTTNERTMIVGAFPMAGAGHSIPILLPRTLSGLLMATFSSLPFDYVTRQKLGGTNMTFNYVEQLPALAPETFEKACRWAAAGTFRAWIERRALELVYTAWDIAPLARDLGDQGPPFVWDPARRAVLRAELDAAFFRLYGIGREDAEYVLSTFPVANRNDPGLAERVLDAYDRIAAATESGTAFVSSLDPQPGHAMRHEERR